MKLLYRYCLILFLGIGGWTPVFGLTMSGKVYDRVTKEPLSDVVVVNVFTNEAVRTDSTGLFSIEVRKGHLVEFRKLGFKVVRIRIESEQLPYYSIGMEKGPYELPEVNVTGSNFVTDSIESSEVFEWAIEHYQLTGADVVAHPFDALSKRNRQIWAFQKRYQYFEQQKFIDYVFNDKLIHTITGLSDDALLQYKIRYRPSYEQIQSWTEYEFYVYIRDTGNRYKRQHQ